MSTLSFEFILTATISTVFCAPLSRTIPRIQLHTCDGTIDQCVLSSPYVIRQYDDQRVMNWSEARHLCFNSMDDDVDGMATLDTSSNAIAVTSLDEQFDFLREICAGIENNDGRKANCWVGGKLNENGDGYIFSAEDTNRPDYIPLLYDPARWGCIRDNDDPDLCKRDMEGNPANGEDFVVLFNNRDYYFADWPFSGGTDVDFQATAVVCNNKAFSYIDRCQCFCDSCDIYGDVHVKTFDDVSFHNPGECVYHAVTPCDEEFNEAFPIEISTENTQCLDGFSSCLLATFVSFYDPDGVLQIVIKFEHIIRQNTIQTTVTYLEEGALDLSGDVELNEAQTWVQNPADESEPWAFLLTQQNEEYELAIWTITTYQTARLHFRDLYGVNKKSLHLSTLHVTLSSCFSDKTCGICGYYDGDIHNELVIRDIFHGALTTVATNADLLNMFDGIIQDIVYDFSSAWVNEERSKTLAEDCNDKSPPHFCPIYYCDDNCVCDGETVQSYNNTKETQCNFDLAACLSLIDGTVSCMEFQYKNTTEQTLYLAESAPHCLYLVETYCCYHAFCSTHRDYCLQETNPENTDNPTAVTMSPTVPTRNPTAEPTPRPTAFPTDAPTAGPTEYPSKNPTTNPTTPYPTTSPIIDSQCSETGIDVVLLVDNSCDLSTSLCKKRQHAISDLVASIKDGSDPRIAYITFADGENSINTWISLVDTQYNDATNRKDLIQYIKKFDCSTSSAQSTQLIYGINAAIDELKAHSLSDSDKKIVIVSHCEDSTGFDACSLMYDVDTLRIDGKSVEITVVNIPIVHPITNNLMSSTYLECLTENEPERFIIIPDINKISSAVNIARFVTAVCEKDTPSPSLSPTNVPVAAPSTAPTPQPTPYPTLAPLDPLPSVNVCPFEGDADVIFLVDITCGLEDVLCRNKRKFVSELILSIKIAHNPRVALLECGDAFGSQYTLKLTDTSFNNINDNTQLTEEERADLYFNKIATRLQCASGSGIPKAECLTHAVNIFDTESDTERIRKIVYIQICRHSDDQEACSTKAQIYNNNIEIIVVNVGELITDQYNDCLFHLGPYNLYRFDDFDFRSAQDISTKAALIDHICSSNTFDIGDTTFAPSRKPTAVPTNKPIVKPTRRRPTKRRRPTEKPTNRQWPTKKPTKKTWNNHNGGSSSDDDDSDSYSDSGSSSDSFGWAKPVADTVDSSESDSDTNLDSSWTKTKNKGKSKNNEFKWDFKPNVRWKTGGKKSRKSS